MITTNNLRVSIVIPVYNEADQLVACLQAIARQTVRPYEVIVVDNNSTDTSASIARHFPFVHVIHEPKQGVVHARNRGFNAARGEVIGRIDADSVIANDWVATVQQLFYDQKLAAVSGAVSYHDLPWTKFLAWLDLLFRQWIANGMGHDVFLFGSNMAVRRTAWEFVRTTVCNSGGLHEDFDLAIHLHDANKRLTFDRRLQSAVSLRRFDVPITSYWRYVWLSPLTYTRHGRRNQYRMYLVAFLVVASYWLIQLIYRSYNTETDSLTWRNWSVLRPSWRVNPATYVEMD